jgi:murein biosynthesis integral membrane protein MurJ
MEKERFSLLLSVLARRRALQPPSVNQRIFRAFLSISSAVLLIRVMGLLNQVVVTSRFGAGAAMDAYFVATALPILAASLVTGALEASVIPTFARVRGQRTPEQASRFFSTLLNALVVGTALLTLLMLIFSRQMVFLVAPALGSKRMDLAIALAPIVFPTFLLLTGIGFLEDILNAEGQFGWPAYAGMIVPLSTAGFVLVAGRSHGIVMLGIGTVVGLCLQVSIVLIRLRRAGITYRPVVELRSPEIALVLAAAWPALCAALISRASPVVDQVFASSLTVGSISALNYALKLISVPTGIIFAAIGRAALPYLSRQVAAQDMQGFKVTLHFYLWITGLVTALGAAFMLVAAHPIVRILFQRGAFTAADTALTAHTLQGFVVGLIPMALGFVTARAFSALRKTRVLLYTSLFSVFANTIFDYIFARMWQSFGIALATSAVYTCTMVMLFVALHHGIGDLGLFTPPAELIAALRKIRGRRQRSPWVDRPVGAAGLPALSRVVVAKPNQVRAMTTGDISRRNGHGAQAESRWPALRPARRFPRWLSQSLLYTIVLIAIFAIGAGSVFMGTTLALRIALGLPLILVFLRYPYVLLLAWACIEVFFGSTVTFFSGNNLETALTIPTVLLMVAMPLKEIAKRMPALTFMLLFLLWVLASIGISGLGVATFLQEWTLTLDYVLIAVLVINVLTTRRRVLGLIDAILGVSGIIALYGIYGYVTHRYGQVDPSTGLFRASSIFGLATALSFHLSLVIPLAVYRAFTVQGIKRLAFSILAVILLLTLGLTFTRAALVVVPVGIIVLALFLPSRRMKLTILGGMSALGFLLVPLSLFGQVNIFDRFFNQDVTTLNGRLYLWRAVIDHFDPGQVLGHGLGASDALLTALHLGDNGVTSTSLIATSAHSLFLGMLYDHGIVGVTLLSLTFVALLVGLVRNARTALGEQRALFATALAVCVVTIGQSIDSNQILIPSLGIYFWIIVALPFARCWASASPPSQVDQLSSGGSGEPYSWSRQRTASRPLVGARGGS